MLVQDESSQAVWIETLDYEFSAQRASDTAKALIFSLKDQQKEPQESDEEGLALEVTTLPVQISFSEEKAPSILMTSSVKPSLGSSWKYATDLQVFLSRFEVTDGGGNGSLKSSRDGHSRHPSGNEVDMDMSAEISADETMDVNAETRIVEVIKSKRLTTGEWCLFQPKD
ncbi:hypothetical protein EC957_001801 [Mortierella hygrophila]|uniref:Uncharacterized protein n=1 Tax=Mortierella hygrophila TaxID=979708 RepID=A0A9P6F4A6_9FUNG|nr:hypothetical protein EC957_001801 [Mortierella hygrophila]